MVLQPFHIFLLSFYDKWRRRTQWEAKPPEGREQDGKSTWWVQRMQPRPPVVFPFALHSPSFPSLIFFTFFLFIPFAFPKDPTGDRKRMAWGQGSIQKAEAEQTGESHGREKRVKICLFVDCFYWHTCTMHLSFCLFASLPPPRVLYSSFIFRFYLNTGNGDLLINMSNTRIQTASVLLK